MPDDIGLRIYSLEYVNELLKVKCGKASIPWFLASKALLETSAELYAEGHFVACVLDEANLAIVRSAELTNQTLCLNVCGRVEDSLYKLVGDPNHRILIYPPAGARVLLAKRCEKQGIEFGQIESYVVSLVQCFYTDSFVFVCADLENASAIRQAHTLLDDIDLKVRLRQPQGANI